MCEGNLMSIVTTILATLVAAEFFFILYLETIATTSDRTAKVFGMTTAELNRPSVNTLFKNQGVYNGVLAILLLVAALCIPSKAAVIALSASMVVVAAYGAATSDPKILLKQGLLPAILLVSCLI